MVGLVIFDVDGTLIDTEKAIIESYQSTAVAEFGERLPDEKVTAVFGVPTEIALERLGFQDIKRVLKAYLENLYRELENSEPYDGIIELLEELKRRGIRCGIVTSRKRAEVDNDKTLQKLMRYFDAAVCVEDTEKHKPDAEPALKLMEKVGCSAHDAIYVGDMYYDYMCAKNAGVKFALAGWGAKYTEGIEADYILNKPEDLLALI